MRKLSVAFVLMMVLSQGSVLVQGAAAATVPEVSIGSASVQEGDGGSILVRVPLTLSAPAATTVKVAYRVTGGTAQAGSDFTAKTGIVAFLAGVAEKPVSVSIASDTMIETNESVRLDLTSVVTANATLGASRGTIDIIDDDANGVPARPEAAIGGVSMMEGDTKSRAALVPVTLSSPATSAVSVDFTTDCGTLSSSDFVAVHTTVKFAIGQRIKTVSVATKPDTAPEPTEAISDRSAVLTGSAGTGDGSGSLSIVDDDAPSTADPTPPPIGIRRVSETAPGVDPTFPPQTADITCGAGLPESTYPSVSEDGRYVAFESNASSLVPGDTNDVNDVFVRDLSTGTIERVSVAADGTQSNADAFGSFGPTMTPDGRFVLFSSTATNLSPDDTNTWPNDFIVDRVAHTIETVQAGTRSMVSSISDDGRYVTFVSLDDVVGGDVDPYEDADGNPISPPSCVCSDVFVRDRWTGTVTQMTTSPSPGVPAWGYMPRISGDGSTIVFESSSKYGAIIPGDTNPTYTGIDYYAKERVSGAIDKLDVDNAGNTAQGYGVYVASASVSTDGRYVSFTAEVCNLGTPCDPVGRSPMEIYVRDRLAHTTTLESRDASGGPITGIGVQKASMSRNARYLLFSTGNTSFLNSFGFPACGQSLLMRDRSTGDVQRIDVPLDGGCGTDDRTGGGSYLRSSMDSQVTSDGRFVVFESYSSNLVAVDQDNAGDVFLDIRY